MIQPRKRNSSKVNLTISVLFHTALILVVCFFAAREGILGKKLKELTVTMVPKEKKPEPPKEKPPEPKVEPPKPAEEPKSVAPPAKVESAAKPPPPAADGPVPAVAPPPVSLPSFDFHDGAKAVQSISDPNGIYKALVEHTLRTRWNRPEDMADETFAAEVEVSLDPTGKIKNWSWLSGSGQARWDDSVKAVMAQAKTISRPPPKGFPDKFRIRFDVESQKTEPVAQIDPR